MWSIALTIENIGDVEVEVDVCVDEEVEVLMDLSVDMVLLEVVKKVVKPSAFVGTKEYIAVG